MSIAQRERLDARARADAAQKESQGEDSKEVVYARRARCASVVRSSSMGSAAAALAAAPRRASLRRVRVRATPAGGVRSVSPLGRPERATRNRLRSLDGTRADDGDGDDGTSSGTAWPRAKRSRGSKTRT
jgi:hypothetical protein